MTTTRTRSRDRRDSRSSAAREGAERRPVILVSAATVIVLLAFGLAVTSAGHVVLAASQHFLLKYSGVFALLALTGSVCMGVIAADRIVMTPGHRVLAQAVHRAVSFGALAFLIIHIVHGDNGQAPRGINHAACAYPRCLYPFSFSVPHFLYGRRHHCFGHYCAAGRYRHYPPAVYGRRPCLEMARHPLLVLRGPDPRRPARSAGRPAGDRLVRVLELRHRHRAGRAGGAGPDPGRLAELAGSRQVRVRAIGPEPGGWPVHAGPGRGPRPDGPAGREHPGDRGQLGSARDRSARSGCRRRPGRFAARGRPVAARRPVPAR